MLLWKTGVDAIEEEMYEAAALDGAGGVRRFWYITLPQLKEIFFHFPYPPSKLSLLGSKFSQPRRQRESLHYAAPVKGNGICYCRDFYYQFL
mgnify:CR=1 FL=1